LNFLSIDPPAMPDCSKLPDSAEQAVRERVNAKRPSDPERYLSAYTKKFGNVLIADNAATLLDEYNRHPAKYRVAVQGRIRGR